MVSVSLLIGTHAVCDAFQTVHDGGCEVIDGLCFLFGAKAVVGFVNCPEEDRVS